MGPTPPTPHPPVLPATVAREVDRLAGELASLLAGSNQPDKTAILSIVVAAVSEKVDQLHPENGVGDPMRAKVPIPPHVFEQARRQLNEAEVLAGLREVCESGGLPLTDFYPDLEKLAEPRA